MAKASRTSKNASTIPSSSQSSSTKFHNDQDDDGSGSDPFQSSIRETSFSNLASRKFLNPKLTIDTRNAQQLVNLNDCDDSFLNNQNDTPVPTPPPPPKQSLPFLQSSMHEELPIHHHFYHTEKIVDDQRNLADTISSPSTARQCTLHQYQHQHSHHHHNHHHHQHQHQHHHRTHRRKRHHRESKIKKLKFPFSSKNPKTIFETKRSDRSYPYLAQHSPECPANPNRLASSIDQNHSQSSLTRASSSISSDQSFVPNVALKLENLLNNNKPNGGLKSKKLKTLIHPLDRSIVGIFTLTIFFTILALLTGAPTVLLLMIVLPIFIGLKKLLQCDLFSLSDLEPVSSIDSYWLTKGHITNCLMYLDKGLSIEQLRDVIATRLLIKPEMARFKSRLIHKGLFRSAFWKHEPEMNNIDDHIIQDDPIECKKSLRKRLIDLMNQTLPMDKPLWQIRYSSANYCDQVILIVRVHQTLSQSGLISILTHYLCDTVPVCSAQKARFGGATLSINILRAIIVGPLTFFLWIMWAFTRRNHNYLTKSKEIKSIHWSTFDLPKIKHIKQVTRSTYNDVFMASIAGSIRSYLIANTNIINPPDLTISIPVDIKPHSPIDSDLIGVNYVLSSSPMPTNTEGAIPRLWEVRHLMEELKTSADTAVMYGSHYLLSRFLPASLYRSLMNLINRNASIYMSNIMGPESSLSIGSHRLNKMHYFLSPPSYCSIVYNIITYENKLYISITTRSKLITNAKELMRQFRSQIDILYELLARRRVPGEGRRIKRPMYLEPMVVPSQSISPSSTVMLQQQAQQQLSPTHYFNPIDQHLQFQQKQLSVSQNDLSNKLHAIQDELNQLSSSYDLGYPNVVQRFEELKDEFTTLLYEMRRRKSLAEYGSNIVINIENQEDDDNDGELRAIPRRFSVSLGRRASIVSSLPSASRVTPPIISRRSMATSPEPPGSTEFVFKIETEC